MTKCPNCGKEHEIKTLKEAEAVANTKIEAAKKVLASHRSQSEKANALANILDELSTLIVTYHGERTFFLAQDEIANLDGMNDQLFDLMMDKASEKASLDTKKYWYNRHFK